MSRLLTLFSLLLRWRNWWFVGQYRFYLWSRQWMARYFRRQCLARSLRYCPVKIWSITLAASKRFSLMDRRLKTLQRYLRRFCALFRQSHRQELCKEERFSSKICPQIAFSKRWPGFAPQTCAHWLLSLCQARRIRLPQRNHKRMDSYPERFR